MLFQNRSRVTQRLSGSAYALTIPGGPKIFPWVLGCVLLGVALGLYFWLQAGPTNLNTQAEVVRLQQDVTRLQQEIKLSEMRFQQEVVTRQELARQMDEQAQKLRQSEQELQFFRVQKAKAAKKDTPEITP